MPARERLDELAAELERLAEQLAEAAMDLLRAALDGGSEAAAALATRQERLVNRARSSVEKAVVLLGQAAAATELDTGEPPGRARRHRPDGEAGSETL